VRLAGPSVAREPPPQALCHQTGAPDLPNTSAARGFFISVAPAAGLEPPAAPRSRGDRRRASGPALLGGASGPRSGPP
jgi:hypothetical protein